VALVGPSRAKDILFSGRLLDAQEALSIGLVDRVVDDAQIEQAAADYARVLLANSLQSISTAKAMINSISGVRPVPDEQLEAGFAASFGSTDFKEGFAAFMEKRAPRFG
jgi:enoyl-CoA hydratase/carnithine racemase